MAVQALGYVGLHARSLDDWAAFGALLLGMQLAERSRAQLVFRMDDRRQRLLVTPDAADGPAFFGWEVADVAALDALAARLEDAGVPVMRADAALCAQRRVAGMVVCADPLGNRIELVHGCESTAEPFRPGRCISGFRTGALGMGHAVLLVPRLEAVLPFYTGLLGFRVSDFVLNPFKAYFLHCNPRHHSLALIEGPAPRLHHLMVECFSLDDVGQGYDLALAQEGRVATTLGRHTNDWMTSFYATTPGGFLMEYGWGGRAVDPATWVPREETHGPSLWGHERLLAPPALREAAARLRMDAAAQGVRAPVQVLPGNHTLRRGECAWWDSAVRDAAE